MTQHEKNSEEGQHLDEPDVQQDGSQVGLQDEAPENTAGREIDDRATGGRETGGREGLEPTRYGDWEKNGRCIDF